MGVDGAQMTAGCPGVFLDRDGVVLAQATRDDRAVAISSAAEYALLPGVVAGVRALKAAGLPIALVTNQPDIATGRVTRADMDAIHRRLCTELPIDCIEVCPHVEADACDCRKPKPGLLIAAARRLGIDAKCSFIIGDRWRDVSAGAAAGCTTILIGGGHGEAFPVPPDHRVVDFAAATRLILSRSPSREKAQ